LREAADLLERQRGGDDSSPAVEADPPPAGEEEDEKEEAAPAPEQSQVQDLDPPPPPPHRFASPQPEFEPGLQPAPEPQTRFARIPPQVGSQVDEPQGRGRGSAAARLLATQMAVSGSSRKEIEVRLRNGFAIEDTSEILDAILGPEE
jgi:hypothetical protein